MTKKLLIPVILISILLAFSVGPLFAAPTQAQIDLAIQKGLTWLASKQADDGHFTNDDPDEYTTLADAATAVLAFEDKGHLPGGNTQYSSVVEKGLDFIFQYAFIADIEMQDNGNPDSNGNGKGIYFSDGSWAYETGMCLMAIITSGKPDRKVTTGDCAGMTYKNVVIDAIDFYAYSQGEAYGGWRYAVNDELSDNSVTQWPVFGILMAQDWGINAPIWVKSQLERWVDFIQNSESGGSGYTEPDEDVNVAKTGGLLVEMYWLGDKNNSSRTLKAIEFINDNGLWESHKGDCYAMFSVFKGLKAMNVTELSNLSVKNWWNDYAQWIVDNQNADGYWESSVFDANRDYDKFLNTGWYILILEGNALVQTIIDLTIQASPGVLQADGKSTSTITVTVKDSKGKPLSGQTVSQAVTKGSGTLPKSPKDNGNGTYTATYTASTVAGVETITATVSNISKTVNITLTASGEVSRILYIGEVTGTPGKEVNVPIGMNDGKDAAGGDITIAYDKSILTYKEIKNAIFTTQPNATTSGTLIISMAGSNPLPGGPGILLEVVFVVSANATPGLETPVKFIKAAVYDATPNDILIATKDGKVTIGQICVKGDVNNDGIINSKDAILVLRMAAGLLEPDALQRCAADANSDNTINSKDAIIVLRKAADLPTAPPANSDNIGFATISLDDVYGVAGKQVTVPINIDKSSSVSGGNFYIVYDSSVLRAVNVEPNSGVLLASNISQPGIVKIAYASTEKLGAEGIANIRFDVLTDNVSILSLKKVELYASDTTTIKLKVLDKKFTSYAARPEKSELLQNFPNPFNPNTWIPFQLKESCEVKIVIYKSTGELVRYLDLGYKSAGIYIGQDRSAYWDGRDEHGSPVASGVYFYSIQAGSFSDVKKMIIQK
jgi:hypothetical protein